MIIGIGTDIVKIERIKKAIKKEFFLNKCFTKKEQLQANEKEESFAGYFAAKEAVAKALGTGFYGFALLDIEVVKNELGMPSIYLYNNAKNVSQYSGVNRIFVSISHEKDYEIAYVILEQ